MKLVSTAAILGLTAILFTGFLAGDPFTRINHLLDRAFHAAPEWTQVQNIYRDRLTQELSHGEDPAPSLAALEKYWTEQPRARRICIMGNSQMFAVSLADGEAPAPQPEKTYTDLVADQLRSRNVLSYRLAAPGLSYVEALWYLDYLLQSPALKPDVLLVQVNYQAFWNGGVRDGMLPMLHNQPFRQTIERAAREGKPYSDVLAEAMQWQRERMPRGASHTGIADQGRGFGYTLESRTRDVLGTIPVFRRRTEQRDEFAHMLYRARLYFLRLNPNSTRSITGARLLRNQAALEAMTQICRANGIRMAVFNAPLNPQVSLYRTEEDRRSYRGFLDRLSHQYEIPVYDLERSIPAPYWGRQYNVPDPLHMGRAGHRMMARNILDILNGNMIRN